MEKTTNSAMERIIKQMTEKFSFSIGEKTTLDSLSEARNKHTNYLIEGIKMMKESRIWTDEELQILSNSGHRIIYEAHAHAVDVLTTKMRDNWEF